MTDKDLTITLISLIAVIAGLAGLHGLCLSWFLLAAADDISTAIKEAKK
jgi:hypothetical protein